MVAIVRTLSWLGGYLLLLRVAELFCDTDVHLLVLLQQGLDSFVLVACLVIKHVDDLLQADAVGACEGRVTGLCVRAAAGSTALVSTHTHTQL